MAVKRAAIEPPVQLSAVASVRERSVSILCTTSCMVAVSNPMMLWGMILRRASNRLSISRATLSPSTS